MRRAFVDQENSSRRARPNRSVTFCDADSYNQNHYNRYERAPRVYTRESISRLYQRTKEPTTSSSFHSALSSPYRVQAPSSLNSPSATHSFVPESSQLAPNHGCNCITSHASGGHVLSMRGPLDHLNNYYSYADPMNVIAPAVSETHEYSLPTGNIQMVYSGGKNGYSSNCPKSVFYTDSRNSFLKYLFDCNILSNRPSQFASFTPDTSQAYSPFIFTVIVAIIVVLLLFTSFLLFQRIECKHLPCMNCIYIWSAKNAALWKWQKQIISKILPMQCHQTSTIIICQKRVEMQLWICLVFSKINAVTVYGKNDFMAEN